MAFFLYKFPLKISSTELTLLLKYNIDFQKMPSRLAGLTVPRLNFIGGDLWILQMVPKRKQNINSVCKLSASIFSERENC